MNESIHKSLNMYILLNKDTDKEGLYGKGFSLA